MDLYHHSNPVFTKWIVDNKLLEERFTVIDVGCQGRPHPRWKMLGDFVDFYGFDPIAEVIDRLDVEYQSLTNYHFYSMALGNEDGQRDFNVRSNSFSSSFYGPSEPAPFDDVEGSYIRPGARAASKLHGGPFGCRGCRTPYLARCRSSDYVRFRVLSRSGGRKGLAAKLHQHTVAVPFPECGQAVQGHDQLRASRLDGLRV